jgi:hypothetical protein
MTTLYAFDAANPKISAAAMVKHGGIVAPVYIVGNPGGMPHADNARVTELRAAGLAPLPNWERAADFFKHATIADAQAAGREALAACRACGFPADGSIDVAFSFDFEIPPANYPAMARLLAAVQTGLGGSYRAIAYAQSGFIDYLAAHGQPGPHWLMGSTWGQPYRPTSPHVALVQSHDTAGTWINSPIPGTDINTVTNPQAVRAWWPDGSPYGGTVSAQDVITALKSPEGQQLLGKAVAEYRIPNHFKSTASIQTLLAYVDERVAATNDRTAATATVVNTLAPRIAQLQAAVDNLTQALQPAQQVVLDTVAVGKAAAEAVVEQVKALAWGVK